MRYAEASQERRERELKDVEMLAERVAIIVESRAPRKTPTQTAPRVITRRLVLGSSGIIVVSADAEGSSEIDGDWTVGSERRGVSSSKWLDEAILDGSKGCVMSCLCGYRFIMIEDIESGAKDKRSKDVCEYNEDILNYKSNIQLLTDISPIFSDV